MQQQNNYHFNIITHQYKLNILLIIFNNIYCLTFIPNIKTSTIYNNKQSFIYNNKQIPSQLFIDLYNFKNQTLYHNDYILFLYKINKNQRLCFKYLTNIYYFERFFDGDFIIAKKPHFLQKLNISYSVNLVKLLQLTKNILIVIYDNYNKFLIIYDYSINDSSINDIHNFKYHNIYTFINKYVSTYDLLKDYINLNGFVTSINQNYKLLIRENYNDKIFFYLNYHKYFINCKINICNDVIPKKLYYFYD